MTFAHRTSIAGAPLNLIAGASLNFTPARPALAGSLVAAGRGLDLAVHVEVVAVEVEVEGVEGGAVEPVGCPATS